MPTVAIDAVEIDNKKNFILLQGLTKDVLLLHQFE
jgi:DNA-directed RNA polymerase alpha subunit